MPTANLHTHKDAHVHKEPKKEANVPQKDAKAPQHEVSAGVIVYRKDATTGSLLYLLVRKSRGKKLWEFPKGKLEPGEGVSHAAMRELREETGIVGKPQRGFVKSVNYDFNKMGVRVQKKVIHFLLEAKDSRVTISDEHSGFLWTNYADARKKLVFDNRKLMLDRAKQFLKRKDEGRKKNAQHLASRKQGWLATAQDPHPSSRK
jgi:8-oxo-dGTP pyrophosphatase MutT (NUDIX family)